MMQILWLLLVLGYGFFIGTAGKFSRAALSFLHGGYLAFLCFAVLPHAMATAYFFMAAAVAGLGVLAGLRLEDRKKLSVLVFAMVTGGQLFFGNPLSLRETLFLSFCGGMGLYDASAGIFPDKMEIRKALCSGAGFLLGTFLLIGI